MPDKPVSTEALAEAAYDQKSGHLHMSASGQTSSSKPQSEATEEDIAAPRLTPQGRNDPDAAGEDSTDPSGGAKIGQPSPAEG